MKPILDDILHLINCLIEVSLPPNQAYKADLQRQAEIIQEQINELEERR